jgi:hypothetical protein
VGSAGAVNGFVTGSIRSVTGAWFGRPFCTSSLKFVDDWRRFIVCELLVAGVAFRISFLAVLTFKRRNVTCFI